MDYRLAKFAAAGAVVGLLGIGGATIASAQDDTGSSSSTTTQTQDEATTATPDAGAPADAAHDGKDCPDHDGTAPAGDTSASADSAS